MIHIQVPAAWPPQLAACSSTWATHVLGKVAGSYNFFIDTVHYS